MISGAGAVTPLGHSISDTLAAVERGESPTSVEPALEGSSGATRVAAVSGFDARPHFRTPKALKVTGRVAQFAVAASAMALSAARWSDDGRAEESLGVVLGSSTSDFRAAEIADAIGSDPDLRCVHDAAWFTERMLDGLNPLWLLLALPSLSSAQVAIQCGARGPNNTLMSDWAAGHQAIGEAFDWIRLDEADAALAGGTDSSVEPLVRATYDRAGLWDRSADRDSGDVPGEGAAVLLLESSEHATRRHAPILGEVNAYANHGPYLRTEASGGALAHTMAHALKDAGWVPADLAMVGTAGTPGSSSEYEETALVSTLGSHARAVRRVQFRTPLGHALAASGPIDLALTLSTARTGRAPVRSLWNAVGHGGQAVTLAVTLSGSESSDGWCV